MVFSGDKINRLDPTTNNLTDGAKSVTFDVSQLADGIYMVVLQNDTGTYTEKLVVE